MHNLKRLAAPRSYRAVAIVGLVVIIGTYLIIRGFASTGVTATEVEAGTVSSAASLVADTSASGSQAVKFGTATGTPATRNRNCVPAVSDTMTNTVSHLCGYPDTTNTGPAGCATFTDVPAQATSGSGWTWAGGDLQVTGNGAVLNCLRVAGTIEIWGNNVTVKNTIIKQAGEAWGIGLYHCTNAIIQNDTIYSDTMDGAARLEVSIKDIYGDTTGTRVLNNNLYHAGTLVQIANGIVTGNYLHDFGYNTGDHINGVTVGGGDLGNMLIQDNTILNQREQTDCVALFQDFGNEANKTIDGNLFAGAGYSVYGGTGSKGTPYNIRVTNNHFSRLFFPNGGSYGPVAAWTNAGAGNTWTNNIWDDTGAVITP